jgi:hypothetical protein
MRGKSYTPEYRAWRSLRERCARPTHRCYKDYGGRGIDYDPRWDAFDVFLSDVGPRPSVKHSLDRRDNARGYWPDNVRWATPTEQARNKRSNRSVTAEGRTLLSVEWAEVLGVKRALVGLYCRTYGDADGIKRLRLRQTKDAQRAKRQRIMELSERTGYTFNTVRAYFNRFGEAETVARLNLGDE